MIPMLILYLIKKFKRGSRFSKRIACVKRIAMKLKIAAALFIVTTSHANDKKQVQHVSYNVVRNNTVIGTINVTCDIENDSTIYSLDSDIDVRFLLKFSIKGEETSIYKNGILIYSSVFRKVNNKVKAHHNVVYRNKKYHLKKSGSSKKLDFTTIRDNLVMLYFKEPKGVKSIYCDNIKSIVKLEELGNGKYKVDFSDGKFNIFHYENGKCVKVEANSALFSVTLIPVQS